MTLKTSIKTQYFCYRKNTNKINAHKRKNHSLKQADDIEITKIKKLECFLVVMDIEKAFDSLDQKFLIYTVGIYLLKVNNKNSLKQGVQS